MAKYNEAISVTFNDNDGGVSWSVNPSCAYDVFRYQRIFGKWRTRWIFFKRFWRALKVIEYQAQFENRDSVKLKTWFFNPEIPE